MEGGVNPYICLPPWMRRCCTGGMPSFSSTFSLIWETCTQYDLVAVSGGRNSGRWRVYVYLVVRLDIEFNLLAGQRSHPAGCMLCQPSCITLGSGELSHLINMLAVVIGGCTGCLLDVPEKKNRVYVYPAQV